MLPNEDLALNNRQLNRKIHRDSILCLLSLKQPIEQYEKGNHAAEIAQTFDQFIDQKILDQNILKRKTAPKKHRKLKSKATIEKYMSGDKMCQSERVFKKNQILQQKKQLVRGTVFDSKPQKKNQSRKRFSSLNIRNKEPKTNNPVQRNSTTLYHTQIESQAPQYREFYDNRLKKFMEKYQSSYKIANKPTAADLQHKQIDQIISNINATRPINQTKGPLAHNDKANNQQFDEFKKGQDLNLAYCGVKLSNKARLEMKRELKINSILKDRYKIIEKIGRGLSGQVFKAKDVLADKLVAIKVISARPKSQDEEYQFYKKIQHKNIVTYYNNFVENGYRYLILEYFPHTLSTLAKRRKFDHAEVKNIFKCLSNALLFLHGMSIAHRDIKMENVVVTQDLQTVKFIDFGLCIDLNQQQNSLSRDFCGTMHYMPPEILAKRSYSPKVADIWSLGILLYKLLFERYPFRGNDEREILHKIQNTKPVFPENCCRNVKNLLQGMLKKNTADRLRIADIIEHEWLS